MGAGKDLAAGIGGEDVGVGGVFLEKGFEETIASLLPPVLDLGKHGEGDEKLTGAGNIVFMILGEAVDGVIEIPPDLRDVFGAAVDAGEDDDGQGRQKRNDHEQEQLKSNRFEKRGHEDVS